MFSLTVLIKREHGFIHRFANWVMNENNILASEDIINAPKWLYIYSATLPNYSSVKAQEITRDQR